MNWLDPFLGVCLILGGVIGWRTGFALSLVPFFSILSAGALAVAYGTVVTHAFHSSGVAGATDGVGRILVLLAATGLLWGFFRWFVQLFLVARLSGPDRWAGMLAMVVAAAFFSASLCAAIDRIPHSGSHQLVHGSAVGGFLTQKAVPATRHGLHGMAAWALRYLEDEPEPGIASPSATPKSLEVSPSPFPTPRAPRKRKKTSPAKDLASGKRLITRPAGPAMLCFNESSACQATLWRCRA